MNVAEIDVKGTTSLTLPYKEIQVMPIGDVQLGSVGVQEERLRKQIKWALAQGNVYFLGMGDYIDVMSPSNREAWASMRKYDSVQAMMDAGAKGLIDRFLKLVAGTKGRWLGLLQGHHYYKFEDGQHSDQIIANALQAPFLSTCAFVRLHFKRPQHGSIHCDIWCHHGEGSGIMPHSPLNRLYHIMNYFDADIYCIGHQTKKPAVKMPRLYLNQAGKIMTKNKVLVGTGGFSEGYVQGSTNYIEQKMLSPVYLGSPLIKIRPVHMTDTDRIDLNVEI
jgi:hypothetical protein